jgi:hypothetical protein
VSHIFREGNQVVDSLANHGLALNSIMYWQELPLFIKDSFDNNKLGLTNYIGFLPLDGVLVWSPPSCILSLS